MTPISKESALSRIHACGLTLAQACMMTDAELLSQRFIGRRTLTFIRKHFVVET